MPTPPTAGSRGRGRGALVLGVLALFVLFLAARFPYQRLLPPLLRAASAASGAQIEVGDLGLGLGWRGPHIVASGVRLRWPAAPELVLDSVRVRPAWSPAWLSGRPVWHVAADGAPGAWAGEVAGDRVAGRFTGVDTDALPWVLLGAPAPLHGLISGGVELARSDGAFTGSARLEGAEGSIDLPGLPVAIPFETLAAELAVAPDQLTLSSSRIEGPLVTAGITGTASAAGGAFAVWPIDLAVEIEAVDPALRGYLGPLGIPVDGQGRARLRVTGSLSAPYLSGLTR